MFSCKDIPKTFLLICVFLALSSAISEKCIKKPYFGSTVLELLMSYNLYGVNQIADQCRDFKYICVNLSDEEFLEFLEELPMTCKEMCKLNNSTQKPICDFMQGLQFIASPIFNLPPKSFQNLDSLDSLQIENTSIADISEKTFYNLTNLKILSLSNNKIRRIDPSTFRDLPMLTELSMGNNRVVNFTMIKLPLIEKLILDNNRIDSIHLEDLVSLQTLFLRYNVLRNLSNCFVNVQGLKTLSLEYNHLEYILSDDLKGMHNLVHLDLSHNKIRSIDPIAFSEMEGLYTLHLEDNLLINLPDNIFSNNLNLGILTLANNHLTDLPDDLFRRLIQLVMLDLDGNAISEIRPETFGIHPGMAHAPADIWVVSLHNNRLQQIDLRMFNHLSTLHLNVSYNYLKSLEIDQLSCDIDASFNDIEQLHSGDTSNPLIVSAAKVTDIRLNNNRIQNMKSGIFSSFSELVNLTLDHNQITELPYGVFDGLHSLTFLNLSQNSIIACPPEVFSPLQELQTLIISNNELRTLDIEKMLDELPELKAFDIDFNKWACDYLHKMLFSDAVKRRRKLAFKSSQHISQYTPHTHSVKGIACLDPKDRYVPTENDGIQNSNNATSDIYEKILKLLEQKNQENVKLIVPGSTAQSSAVLEKDDISKYDNHFNGLKTGIIVLIIFVVMLGLVSVYNIYETRRWRQQTSLYRMSVNTMMEDI